MKYTVLIFLIILTGSAYSQRDSILHQGMYRTFILHLPEGYNENTEYPIVLNLHGLGSNSLEQEFYSGFDAIADEEGFIVVYPDAVENSWDLFGTTDVDFLSYLIDTLRDRYSTNDCLFSTGMSQGGFLSYKLACELPQPITAVAVVTGNMTIPWMSSCSVNDGMPVMHFHGTADQLVLYNGSFGVPPVEEAIAWWATENMCNMTPIISELPDINMSDGSTVEEHRYADCASNSDVILYKVLNGGHTWPGAIPIPSFGNTNQDIDASTLIGNFFEIHCDNATHINPLGEEPSFLLYPNPSGQLFMVDYTGETFDLYVYDMTGKIVFYAYDNHRALEVNSGSFPNGIYLVKVNALNGRGIFKKVVILN